MVSWRRAALGFASSSVLSIFPITPCIWRKKTNVCSVSAETSAYPSSTGSVCLSGLKQTEPVEDGYAEVSALTEQTFVFFRHMQGVIGKIDRTELDANPNAALLQETMSDLAPKVANTAMVVQFKAEASE